MRHPFIAYAVLALAVLLVEEIERRRERMARARAELNRRRLERWRYQSDRMRAALRRFEYAATYDTAPALAGLTAAMRGLGDAFGKMARAAGGHAVFFDAPGHIVDSWSPDYGYPKRESR